MTGVATFKLSGIKFTAQAKMEGHISLIRPHGKKQNKTPATFTPKGEDDFILWK